MDRTELKHLRRLSDMEEKAKRAFAGNTTDEITEWAGSQWNSSIGYSVHAVRKRCRCLQLQFVRAGAYELQSFLTVDEFMHEYSDPNGYIRGQLGYRQQHFADALDRLFKIDRWWEDIYEQEEPIGYFGGYSQERIQKVMDKAA